MRRTKIICTIGPASRDPELLRTLIRSGMNVARLNFSHGDEETHLENVRRIRSAAESEDRPVAIQIDLQGPKFRMGMMVDEGVFVEKGGTVTLTTEAVQGNTPENLPVQNENFPDLVKQGDRVLIDDGLIDLQVLSTTNREVQCQVLSGGSIKSNKGINLPGVTTELPSMTEKDFQDLAHAVEWEVDWIALSFVRTAEDVEKLKNSIQELTDRPVPVMAKIEKPEALKNIDEIIEVADAVMVARGDLGIEIPTEQVPMTQKRIIERCNEVGIPVVTATQMLDSMIRNPRPTRAEASDVANAILDGTDAVMLSGETTIGDYPVEALQTMERIICEVESERTEIPPPSFRALEEGVEFSIARAVAHAARDAAQDLGIAAIIAVTASGYTARIVSRYRPNAPIIAITPDERVQRELMLYWGVSTLLAPRTNNTDEMINNALRVVKERGMVKNKDLVAITAGTAGSNPGTTNLLRVHVVT
jgi:pyruvate kinase